MLPTPASLLGELPLFAAVAPPDRERIAAVGHLRSYRDGEVLFREGDIPDSFLFVIDGLVKLVKSTPAGKEVILEIFGAGDPVGVVAAYAGQPLPATAEALTTARCLAIPAGAFFALLEAHPKLVRGLLAGLTHRLVELTNRLSELAGARVEERLARLLLRKAGELGTKVGAGTFVPLALSRQELADLAGTTLETAIRVMSRWGKRNLVETRDDGFVLLDARALAGIAGIDAA
ncbi:MAG: Crp/Fnr family transcriptional regulator [Thermoanaerobaculia bacterium]